ncbi:MAG: DUF1573 domain-containing protein [Bacteroidota bacterium]
MNFKKISIIITLFAILVTSGCKPGSQGGQGSISTDVVNNPNSASGKPNSGSLPSIKFDDIEHDFGRIIEGETVSYSFNFKNTGKSDLLIAEVSTSCGCTVPSYPRTPIRAGETGTIKVAFNSNGKRGYQNKNILVVSNTQPNTTVIRIKAQVVNPGADKK